MAIVRMSRDLVMSLLDNAGNTFKKRVDTATASFSFPYTPNQFYNVLFGQWRSHMEALPEEFFVRSTQMYVRKIGHINAPSILLVLGSPHRFPMSLPDSFDFRIVSYSRGDCYIDLLDDPGGSRRWGALIAQAVVWREEVDKLVSERDTFVSSVRKVVSAHPTLNSALKSWPALWELVPEDVKNRVRTPVSRNKSDTAKIDIDVDINKLTAVVAASKIL